MILWNFGSYARHSEERDAANSVFITVSPVKKKILNDQINAKLKFYKVCLLD